MDGSPIRQKTYAVNKKYQKIEAEGVEFSIYGAITELISSASELIAFDVSKCITLTYLECGSNKITELDVSKNVALTKLVCSNNQLISLDISKNTALNYLSCNTNQLAELDVSKNTALSYFDCNINQLTELNLSKNVALTDLSLGSNQFATLDISKNVALTHLGCSNIPTITTLSVASSYGKASVSTALATLITDATSTTGTLNIYGGDNATVHTAATTKGWTVNTNL